MSLKQGQYSDKSVYENIDKQIKELKMKILALDEKKLFTL